ncbi:hypothetical protein HN682_07750 [Candidatus Peregrinibacteria bacterium]|nr:hypothetical protein [Candidatus Peregrinibacteria bacterium]
MIFKFEKLDNGVVITLFQLFQFSVAWPIEADPQCALSIGFVGLRLEVRIDGNDYK